MRPASAPACSRPRRASRRWAWASTCSPTPCASSPSSASATRCTKPCSMRDWPAASGDNLESIEGQLTLLGVSWPVKLTVSAFKCAPHSFNKKDMCGADASAQFKRSDFGMKTFVGPVSDEAQLQRRGLQGVKRAVRSQTARATHAGTSRTASQPNTKTTGSADLGSRPPCGPARTMTPKNAATATAASEARYARTVRRSLMEGSGRPRCQHDRHDDPARR